MSPNRRQFSLGLTTALLGLGASHQLRAQTSEDRAPTSLAAASPTAPRPYFFKNPTFEIIFLTSLGRAYHSGRKCRKGPLSHSPGGRRQF